MKTRCYLLHTYSPLHAGTGQSVDLIDLPLARGKATGIPLIPGSSIKGVLKDARRPPDGADQSLWKAVFGPERVPEVESSSAGALLISDARLLALPVRSFFGTFAWVTSPLLLRLAARDLEGTLASGRTPDILPTFPGSWALVPHLGGQERSLLVRSRVYLEDLDLETKEDKSVASWGEFLSPHVDPDFSRRFAVVDDETMTFLWETATQIDARVRLDPKTGTVAQGALWLEESLPPETLLLGLMSADRARPSQLGPDVVLEAALKGAEILQFGGKATVGRGRCRLSWLDSNARGE